jgi:hypothetical protein
MFRQMLEQTVVLVLNRVLDFHPQQLEQLGCTCRVQPIFYIMEVYSVVSSTIKPTTNVTE